MTRPARTRNSETPTLHRAPTSCDNGPSPSPNVPSVQGRLMSSFTSRPMSSADRRYTPVQRKVKPPTRKWTPDNPWSTDCCSAPQAVQSIDRVVHEDHLGRCPETAQFSGVHVSHDSPLAERSMHKKLDAQQMMNNKLVEENKRLSAELEEIQSLYEQLIGEASGQPRADGNKEREQYDGYDQRIKLLQSVNIQLERQVLAQAEAIRSRAGLVDEASGTVEEVLRILDDPAPSAIRTACESLSRLNARIRRQLPLWKSSGIMAIAANDENDGALADRSLRNLRFAGLFLDPERTARRRNFAQSHVTRQVTNGAGVCSAKDGLKNSSDTTLGVDNSAKAAEMLENNRPYEPVKLLDICTGGTEHLNLRMVAVLESRLRLLYGELRNGAAILQHANSTSAVQTGGIGKLVAKMPELQRELDSVADMLFRLSVLVPASPFVSTGTNVEVAAAIRKARKDAEHKGLEHAMLELPSLDNVLGRLPQFSAAQRSKVEEVLGHVFRGWRSYQEMYVLEIAALRSVLTSESTTAP